MYFWLSVLVTGSSRPIGLDYILAREQSGMVAPGTEQRSCSSAGRAPDLHSGGRRFDPDQLHQLPPSLFSLCDFCNIGKGSTSKNYTGHGSRKANMGL